MKLLYVPQRSGGQAYYTNENNESIPVGEKEVTWLAEHDWSGDKPHEISDDYISYELPEDAFTCCKPTPVSFKEFAEAAGDPLPETEESNSYNDPSWFDGDAENEAAAYGDEEESFEKADMGKPPLEMLYDVSDALSEVVRVMQHGAEKYGRKNWALGSDDAGIKRYESATLRHMFALKRGEILDPESGYLHRAHAICSQLFLLQMEFSTAKVEVEDDIGTDDWD